MGINEVVGRSGTLHLRLLRFTLSSDRGGRKESLRNQPECDSSPLVVGLSHLENLTPRSRLPGETVWKVGRTRGTRGRCRVRDESHDGRLGSRAPRA